jgi:hypothetical protein
MKKDFQALLDFFTDSDSNPRRMRADGSKHLSADTQELISNIGAQLRIFEEMFLESW